MPGPIVLYWIGISCFVVGVAGAILWTVLDVVRERRRERARARRRPELEALDYRGDLPRRFRVEESLRFKLEESGDIRRWRWSRAVCRFETAMSGIGRAAVKSGAAFETLARNLAKLEEAGK